MAGKLFIIGTPIGNLKDMTFRAVEILKSLDVLYCEDTRHSLKLLNAYEIRKPLKSLPHFREKMESDEVIHKLSQGQQVGVISDAGMPGICDPGSWTLKRAREAGYETEVIGGVSSLTYFISGCGEELENFEFVGFLPSRRLERERLVMTWVRPTVFFESPHRVESTLEILKEKTPQARLVLGKEFSKISERFFTGSPEELAKGIPSFKGEWVGLWRAAV